MKSKSMMFLVAGIMVTLLSFTGQAAASQYIFDLNAVIPGQAFTPNTPAPWLTATFTDVSVGTVDLTLQANNIGTQFVSEWDFNYVGAATIGPLFTLQAGATAPTPDSIGTLFDGYKAAGAGDYDIQFMFPTPGNANRFDGNEFITYRITATGLIAADFNQISVGGGNNGDWYTAAHIQAIGADSSWVRDGGSTVPTPTPEPATLLLLGCALAGLYGIRRKVS